MKNINILELYVHLICLLYTSAHDGDNDDTQFDHQTDIVSSFDNF